MQEKELLIDLMDEEARPWCFPDFAQLDDASFLPPDENKAEFYGLWEEKEHKEVGEFQDPVHYLPSIKDFFPLEEKKLCIASEEGQSTQVKGDYLRAIDETLAENPELTESLVDVVPSKIDSLEEDLQLTSIANESLDAMKAELKEKLAYLDKQAQAIKKMLQALDVDLFKNILMTIKKAVKKIILKELHLDEGLMQRMIEQVLADLKQEQEALILYVAKEQYPIFAENIPFPHLEVNVSADLNEGDFIIKTKAMEIQMLLDARLNALFEI